MFLFSESDIASPTPAAENQLAFSSEDCTILNDILVGVGDFRAAVGGGKRRVTWSIIASLGVPVPIAYRTELSKSASRGM